MKVPQTSLDDIIKHLPPDTIHFIRASEVDLVRIGELGRELVVVVGDVERTARALHGFYTINWPPRCWITTSDPEDAAFFLTTHVPSMRRKGEGFSPD